MLSFRWKRLLIPAVLGAALLFAPDDSLGQRGGFGGSEGGRGGGRGFDPGAMADMQFTRLQQSYGGSGDSLDYSKIPAQTRESSNMMAQRFGSPPLPTSGTVSRTEYKAEAEKRMAARMPGGMPGGGPPSGSPTPPTGGGNVVVIGPGGTTDGKPTAMTMTPGGGPGMTMTPGGPPPGGGGWGGGGQMTAESRFKEMDRSPTDGKISKEEAASGSRRLAGSFEQNDTNKDGFIDVAEYTVYFNAAMGGGSSGQGGGGWNGGGSPGGWNGGGGNPGEQSKRVEEQDEPKPVVYKFGSLPQGLPSYFTEADYDKDGQVGLYEWVKHWGADPKLDDFKALDVNGDGLLTVEEYMRVKKVTPAALATGPGRGGPPSFGNQPSSGTPGTRPQYAPPPSPGAVTEDASRKDDRTRDLRKEEKKEEKKDERSRDSKSSGDYRGPRPSGDGSNPFNPTGGSSGGGRSGR